MQAEKASPLTVTAEETASGVQPGPPSKRARPGLRRLRTDAGKGTRATAAQTRKAIQGQRSPAGSGARSSGQEDSEGSGSTITRCPRKSIARSEEHTSELQSHSE